MAKILVVGADATVINLLQSKLPEHEFITENSEHMAILMIDIMDKNISAIDVDDMFVAEINATFEHIKQETDRVNKILIVDDGMGTSYLNKMLMELDNSQLPSSVVENILIHEVDHHFHFHMPQIYTQLNSADRYYHNYTKPYGRKHRQRF